MSWWSVYKKSLDPTTFNSKSTSKASGSSGASGASGASGVSGASEASGSSGPKTVNRGTFESYDAAYKDFIDHCPKGCTYKGKYKGKTKNGQKCTTNYSFTRY